MLVVEGWCAARLGLPWAHSGGLVVGVFRVEDALTAERERANFCKLQWPNKAWHAGPILYRTTHVTEPETRDPRSVHSILDQHILLLSKKEKDQQSTTLLAREDRALPILQVCGGF